MFGENEKECIEILRLKQGNISYAKIEERYQQSGRNGYQLVTEKAMSGEEIQIIEKSGKRIYFNSRYEPLAAARLWAQQYDREDINDHNTFLVYGLGDGLAITELLKVIPKSFVIIYEPCTEIFWDAIKRKNVKKILEDARVLLYVNGINQEFYFDALQTILNYTNCHLAINAVLPNYSAVFPEEYQKMLEVNRNILQLIVYTRNTFIERSLEIARNGYALMSDIIHQSSVTQMSGTVKKAHLEDIPAILVAAGPSLDKNIEVLKKAEGKAFIMAVDTALNTVLENGILPDMTISVDSRKPMVLFKNEKFAEIPIVLSQQSRIEVAEKNKAKHFYELNELGYLNHISKKETQKEWKQLDTGGSVANNGLSFLVEMGFQTIILVGQDLAYPENREHAKAAYNGKNDTVDTTRKHYFEIESNSGKKVLTEANMDIYRRWIESYIARYSELRVINTSIDGARIEGTEVKNLEECISELCLRQINKEMLFPKEEGYFTEEEKQKVSDKIQRIPEELEELKQLIEKSLKLYQELEGLNKKENADVQKIKEVLGRIGQVNESIENSDVSELIKPYMMLTSYIVGSDVYKYKKTDTVFEQVQDIIRNGRQMMEGYETGIGEFEKDLPLIMKDWKKE